MAISTDHAAFIPTPELIATETARLRAEHLARKRQEPDSLNPSAARLRALEWRRRKKAEAAQVEMTRTDICNGSLISDDELADAMGMLFDCVGLQTRANDIAGRWTLGDIDPEAFDVSDDYLPEPTEVCAATPSRFR